MGRLAKTYIHQRFVDTGSRLGQEDFSRVMENRGRWQEREKERERERERGVNP